MNHVDRKVSVRVSILLGLSALFMFFILGPTDVFFSNVSEFDFDYFSMMLLMLIGLIISLFFVSVILSLLGKFRFAPTVYSLCFFMTLFFYIQGNYIPRNYGVLNGSEIEWEKYPGLAVASLVLAVVILLLFVFVIVRFKDKSIKICTYGATILLAIQVISVGILIVQNRESIHGNSENIVFTTSHFNEYSENENIIVLVLDSFDSSVMEECVNEGIVDDMFDGFTYYPNTIGAYPTTVGAVSYILTGEWNENKGSIAEYQELAYKNSPLFSNLENSDYQTDVYATGDSVYTGTKYFANEETVKVHISNEFGFIKTMLKLICFDYFPHQFKQYFYVTNSDFDSYIVSDSFEIYKKNVPEVYSFLCNSELSVSLAHNNFKYIHTKGIHPPYEFNAELETINDGVLADEVQGCFTFLRTYFDVLKENGVYDNSCIIVMADHGFSECSGQHPLFMVKNRYESHSLQISDAAVSYEYLQDVFESFINNEIVDENYFESYHGDINGRRFLLYSSVISTGNGVLPTIEEMYFYDSYEFEDGVYTGKVYDSLALDTSYTLGDEIYFNKDGTSERYCQLGFSVPETENTWTSGYRSYMKFDIGDDYKGNVEVTIDYSTFGEQEVTVKAGGEYITEFVANGKQEVTFVVSSEYINNGVLELEFDFPDAVSPLTLGISNDKRILALFIHRMVISPTASQIYEVTVTEIQ